MGSSRLRVPGPHLERKELPLPTFDVPYFKYIDEEDEDDEWSSRSQSSTEDDSVDSLLSDRYVVVSGTPEKILEHLLNDLHLEEVQDKETGKNSGWGVLGEVVSPGFLAPLSIALGQAAPVIETWVGSKNIRFVALSFGLLLFCFHPVNGHMEIGAAVWDELYKGQAREADVLVG